MSGLVGLPDPVALGLLAAAAAALTLVVLLLAPAERRREVARVGAVGLAAGAAIACSRSLVLVGLILLVVSLLRARAPQTLGRDVFRGGVLAACLLMLGAFVEGAEVQGFLPRLGAVALVLGLIAAVGLVPHLPRHAADEPPEATALAWTVLGGPVVAVSGWHQVLGLVEGGPESTIAAGLMIAAGLLNVAWGVFAAWRAGDTATAWRDSFVAEWGLALAGLGMLTADGRAGSFLVLLSLLLVRLPLWFAAGSAASGKRGQSKAKSSARLRPITVLWALLLAGAAPFAGFPARILLLRGATELFWLLAVLLGILMVLWLPHSLRLARTVPDLGGRARWALYLAALAALVLGLDPALVLRPVGL